MASSTGSRSRGLPTHPRDSTFISRSPRPPDLQLDQDSSHFQLLSQSTSAGPAQEPATYNDSQTRRSSDAGPSSPRSSVESYRRRTRAGERWSPARLETPLPAPVGASSAFASLETASSRKAPTPSSPPPSRPPRSPRRPSGTPTMDSRRTSMASSVYVTPMSQPPSADKGKGREVPVSPLNGYAERFRAASPASSARTASTAMSDIRSTSSTSTVSSTLEDLPPMTRKETPSRMRDDPVWRGSRAVTESTRWSQSSETFPRSLPAYPETPTSRDVFGSARKQSESAAKAHRMAQLLDEQADMLDGEHTSLSEPPSPVLDRRTLDRRTHRRIRSDGSPPPSTAIRSLRIDTSSPPSPSLPDTLVSPPAALAAANDVPRTTSPTHKIRAALSSSSPAIRERHSSLQIEVEALPSETSSVNDSSAYATPDATPELGPMETNDDKILPPSPNEAFEEDAKRRRTRARAIQELISTEWTYAQDLAIARDVYFARAQGVPLGEIASHIATSTDFVPPPTPMMSAHAFVPLSPTLQRRSFAPSPALSSAATFTSPTTSATSLPSPRSNAPMQSNDVRTIFINLPELAAFGAAFSGVLDSAAGTSSDVSLDDAQDDRIGEEFLRMIPRIAQLYSTYCSRHGAALQRLDQLEPSLADYTSECQQLCQSLTHSWSLGSLLIKPVQRCLKYPLLIETILANTLPDHPDRPALELALEKMLGVAQELNEAKRRNEVVGKVVNKRKGSGFGGMRSNGGSSSFGQTVSKKLLRSGRGKTSVGSEKGTQLVEDPEEAAVLEVLIARLDAQQDNLRRLQIEIRGWVASVTNVLLRQRQLLDTWAGVYDSMPGEAQLHGGGRDLIMAYTRAVETIENGPLVDLAARVSYTLLPLISRFDITYAGPQAVIAKRMSKRPDYERATSNARSASNDRSAQEGRQAYLSLSRTLAEELPVFLGAITKALDGIIAEIAGTQSDFYRRCHATLATYERTYCAKFAGAENLVASWWALSQPLTAALDGLLIASSKRLMRQAEATAAARSSWRSSVTSTSSAPAALRANSVPTQSLESLIADETYGTRGRRATADANIPSSPTISRSGLSTWLRRGHGQSRPPTPTTPDELSSTRRFFTSTTPSASTRAPSPSPPLPAAAHAIIAAATATATSVGRPDFELERNVSIPVHYRARAAYATEGNLLVDGKPTLMLMVGDRVGVLWQEDDGWVFARSEKSGLEGYVRAEALSVVRGLPPGAGK